MVYGTIYRKSQLFCLNSSAAVRSLLYVRDRGFGGLPQKCRRYREPYDISDTPYTYSIQHVKGIRTSEAARESKGY